MRNIKISPTHVQTYSDAPTLNCLTPNFSYAFFGAERPTFGISPPAVRWTSRDGCQFLLERPPHLQMIQYYHGNAWSSVNDRNSIDVHRFEVAMPWTEYFIVYSDAKLKKSPATYVFARPDMLRSPKDELYVLGFPNIPAGTLVCSSKASVSHYEYKMIRNQATIADALTMVSGQFWDSEFNNDITPTVDLLPPQIIKELEGSEAFHSEILTDFLPVLELYEKMSIPEAVALERPQSLQFPTLEHLMKEENLRADRFLDPFHYFSSIAQYAISV